MRLWDVATGRQLQLMQHADGVQSVAISPDGRRGLADYRDQTVYLWDFQSVKMVCRFTGHKGRVWGVAFSPDGWYALSGGEDRTIRLWGLPPAD